MPLVEKPGNESFKPTIHIFRLSRKESARMHSNGAWAGMDERGVALRYVWKPHFYERDIKMSAQNQPAQPAPIAMKPADAAKYIGLSRARIYELLAAGELTAKKYGCSTLVTTASMHAFIDRCETAKFQARVA